MSGDEKQSELWIGEAKEIVADLFKPNPAIYWLDFLGSMTVGGIAFWLFRWVEPWWAKLACYLVSSFAIYRAVLFTHELTHLRKGTFRAFRIVWNLMCGIPFLLPSYTYYVHLNHHRRHEYGTKHDAEYLPLASGSPWKILTFLLVSFLVPFGAMFRFVVLTPIAWFVPSLRRWLDRRASSMVINYSFVRDDPSPEDRTIWRIQETSCFVLWTVLLTLFVLEIRPIMGLVQIYATAVFIILLNEIRTAAAHHYTSDGEPVSFTEQIIDSVNVPGTSLLTALWAPVGLRYHALHHFFPSMPYHSLHQAHLRLMEKLPEDSPYRLTVRSGLWDTISELWGNARRSQQKAADPSWPEEAKSTT